MILDKIKEIIREEIEGSITIRGYNVKIAIDYPFRLKVHHLAKPLRYILQDLFPEKYKITEEEKRNIDFGRAVDELVKEIWDRLSDFYKNNKLYIDLNSLLDSILNKRNLREKKEEFLKLSKIILSSFSLLFSLGFEPYPYRFRINRKPERIPLQFTGIEPDIVLKRNGIFVGDVKYGKYREEYKNLITSYALIFEEITKEDVDYGILVYISHDFDLKIEIFKINDKLRSETIELIKRKYEEVSAVVKNIRL